VSDQVDSQEVGQGLGGERPAGTSASQLGVYGPHRSPEVREMQTVERWDSRPHRVDVERTSNKDEPVVGQGRERPAGCSTHPS